MTGERAELFETYRSSFRVLISTITFLTTANVTVIGFAVSNRSAILIFLGSLFPVLLLIGFFMFSRVYGAIFFSGMRVNDRDGDQGSLFFSSSLLLAKPELYYELKSIVKIDDDDEQLDRLLTLKSQFTPPFSLVIVPTIAFLQVCGSLMLWYYSGWSFF